MNFYNIIVAHAEIERLMNENNTVCNLSSVRCTETRKCCLFKFQSSFYLLTFISPFFIPLKRIVNSRVEINEIINVQYRAESISLPNLVEQYNIIVFSCN